MLLLLHCKHHIIKIILSLSIHIIIFIAQHVPSISAPQNKTLRTTFTAVLHRQLWVKGSRFQLKLWISSNLFLQNIQKINVLVIKNINYMHFIRIISRQFCTVYHHMLSDTNACQKKLKIGWVWHIKTGISHSQIHVQSQHSLSAR